MTKAKITKANGYMCAPGGARAELFACGAMVSGQVAVWALADRAASATFEPREEVKVVEPAETKRVTGKRK